MSWVNSVLRQFLANGPKIADELLAGWTVDEIDVPELVSLQFYSCESSGLIKD